MLLWVRQLTRSSVTAPSLYLGLLIGPLVGQPLARPYTYKGSSVAAPSHYADTRVRWLARLLVSHALIPLRGPLVTQPRPHISKGSSVDPHWLLRPHGVYGLACSLVSQTLILLTRVRQPDIDSFVGYCTLILSRVGWLVGHLMHFWYSFIGRCVGPPYLLSYTGIPGGSCFYLFYFNFYISGAHLSPSIHISCM